MNEIQSKLIAELKNMFQFDQSDLDFGIYRIMAMKRAEIARFLETDLTAQITEGLTELKELERSSVSQKRLEEIERQCVVMGIDVQTTKLAEEYNRLKAELSSGIDVSDIERDIYNHLYEFFSRYYDDGDFISQRRYKDGVYAIPYEGEEVKLHWANADQYYVKTSENFKNYSFKNGYGQVCNFKLVDAETERDNNKAKVKRLFQLRAEAPFELDGESITIYLEFKAGDRKQDAYIADIITTFQGAGDAYTVAAAWLLATRDGKTKLERELNRYTAKNTFDYFIHKDLAGFLNRELDFFIKSEVFFIDDVDEQSFAHTRAYITKTKVLRRIARKIIAFLAQIENFQKKLYLKKKFVVETNYCITLDRVSEAFYAEIATNDAQRKEWVRLFAIDEIQETVANEGTIPGYSVPMTVEFLKANPFLVLDTAFFGTEFKELLVASIDDLDDNLNGLLIHSENLQALQLVRERYKRQIDGIYIDPPYNTDQAPIMYKNGYKDSSWLAMIYDRLIQGKPFLKEKAIECVTIDDVEYANLFKLMQDVMSDYELRPLIIEYNHRGRAKSNFSYTHEFGIFAIPGGQDLITRERELSDDISRNLRRTGTDSTRQSNPGMFYGIEVRIDTLDIIAVTEALAVDEPIPEHTNPETCLIWPIDDDGIERRWYYGKERIMNDVAEETVWAKMIRGRIQIHYFQDGKPKHRKSLLTGEKIDSSTYGSELLNDFFGMEQQNFTFPKSIYAVEYCLESMTFSTAAIFLDYFAGSGTTAHAVINLNRADEGKRKYILCEMGEYFDTATKPRVQKVIYSGGNGDDKYGWNKGKPTTRKGSSHAFKYLRLESYEDALQNISLPETVAMPDLFAEEYMLRYMLNSEADGQSLLPMDSLAKPFDYKLNITCRNESKTTYVDLPETFNYLLGLTVKKSHSKESLGATFSKEQYGALSAVLTEGDTYTFKAIEGTLPNGETSLIIWRTLTDDINRDNAVMDAYRTKFGRYRKVFVNGDCNIENAVLIEEVMKQKMFEGV